MASKDEILNFIKSKLLMIISTVNEFGHPESSVVGFGETDDFEIVFGTSKLSRKAANINK